MTATTTTGRTMANPRAWDRHLNPECASGKHQNCRKDAWCYIDDCRVACLCDCHGKSN